MKPTEIEKKILQKLEVTALNEMQVAAREAIAKNDEVLLLSPTGSGKTLAFLLPLTLQLDTQITEVQLLILAPSRELALQIETVIRTMGTGYKVNAVYGGQHFSKDKTNLKHRPAILVGTPGRVADHLRRETFPVRKIKTLVIDEFDKALEIGFEKEMKAIVWTLKYCRKTILTSATYGVQLPDFLPMRKAVTLNYLEEKSEALTLKKIISPTKDKLETLGKTLHHLGNDLGIVFCNYKESIRRISDYLTEQNIPHGCYYGGLEQKDRERALIKFRNGTHRLILATDLASRGLDIPEIKFIIHYHLPINAEAFTHRNGRTARMNATGAAYVLSWAEERLPHFLPELKEELLEKTIELEAPEWTTLFLSGGRKDKISKGDIVGLFIKQGQLDKSELGVIEIKQDCAFVGVAATKANSIIALLDNVRLKKKKIRIREI